MILYISYITKKEEGQKPKRMRLLDYDFQVTEETLGGIYPVLISLLCDFDDL